MSGDKTPSAQLAELTVNKLIEAGFLRADKRDSVVSKITAGEMLSTDWKLEIDLASGRGIQK